MPTSVKATLAVSSHYQELQQAADELFGEETYYAKVDRSPPERAQRVWERRGSEADHG